MQRKCPRTELIMSNEPGSLMTQRRPWAHSLLLKCSKPIIGKGGTHGEEESLVA